MISMPPRPNGHDSAIAERPDAAFPSIPGEITATSLSLPAGLPYEEWERVGRLLQSTAKSIRWFIGDWLLHGERAYGEQFVQAVEATGRKVQDIKNMMWVSEHVEKSRRRDSLTWSHHAEVASLTPEEQTAWLDVAEAESLNTRELREHIHSARTDTPVKVPHCSRCGGTCKSCEADIRGLDA